MTAPNTPIPTVPPTPAGDMAGEDDARTLRRIADTLRRRIGDDFWADMHGIADHIIAREGARLTVELAEAREIVNHGQQDMTKRIGTMELALSIADHSNKTLRERYDALLAERAGVSEAMVDKLASKINSFLQRNEHSGDLEPKIGKNLRAALEAALATPIPTPAGDMAGDADHEWQICIGILESLPFASEQKAALRNVLARESARREKERLGQC